MKISLRIKLSIALSIILITTGTIFSFFINQVLKANLENTIKNSMMDIMKNSREYVRYRIIYKNLPFNEEGLKLEVGDISDYFLTTYSCESQLFNMCGNMIQTDLSQHSSFIIDKSVHSAADGRALVNIQYQSAGVSGILTYPLYFNDKYLGIIVVSKSYNELYNNNKRIINVITAIECIVFIIIYILSNVFVSYIIKPLKRLTQELKKVGEGDFEADLGARRKDEIGILTSEFVIMKQKLGNQINIINAEKEKVLRLEGSRKEFFDNVTHELKTPLTAISGYAQMLMDENITDTEFKRRAVERIYMESERMSSLVLDLINVSKGSALKDEDTKIIEMSVLLNDICDDMAIRAKKYLLEIEREIGQGFILCQNNKIRQLVINLLDNAIKYSYRNEVIFLKAYDSDNDYILEVTNTGEKISKDIYNKIFEPFVKGIKSNETDSSGLGLYICSEIVKAHNGEIFIENGEKVKVTVKIPSSGNNLETT